VIAALRKHGIKFKPKDQALSQLRGLGATEALITAVKSCNVVVLRTMGGSATFARPA
jgi:hypothetical protein